MVKKTVLDVGNCGPDFSSIKRMLEAGFDAEVLQTHGPTDTLELLKKRSVDLVLINRKLDQDYSDGIEILKLLKEDEALAEIPVMITTNYDEHQEAAMSLGAIRGFGKLSLNTAETRQRLQDVLGK